MLYLFKVYALATTAVFGFSGMVMLAILAYEQAKEYSRARHVMARIASGRFRESLAISRTASRLREDCSIRSM